MPMTTPTRRAQRRAQLTPGRLGQFAKTKDVGAPIDLIWPCTNVGDAEGVAFIKVLENGIAVWVGPPFPVPAKQTVGLNLHETIDLSLGLHNMVPQMHEGFPPDGVGLIAADTLALTVVSIPVLAAVGVPTIDGIPGATTISVISVPGSGRRPYPISWNCMNSGGGSGQARLRVVTNPQYVGSNVTGTLTTIPGLSTATLLLSVPTLFAIGDASYTVTLTMEDQTGLVLGTWIFLLVT